ncbi:MAG: lipid II flippase MurJ, partial [Candidatus Gracilibacteria bacterium]|nr:lipid II flippase MurJ [Candidatus Gracilibacteria bacterium]
MFKRSFFRNQSSSLGASILAIAYAGSYLLGLVRDRTLAYYFPTAIKETYDAAFQVPDLIFNLFAAGILSAAVFLPIFRELVDEKEEEKAYSLASTLMNLISIIIIAIGLVCFFTMPALTKLIVPGFDPERQVLVTNLSRIMLLSPLLFGVSNVIGNILYSFKRFFSYGFAILLYNGSIILSIIFLQASLGIYSAAIGLVIGVLLHLVFRLIELSFTPFKYRFGIQLKSTEFWQLIKLAIPKTLGQITYQGNLFIFNRIGSLLQAGSISAFSYARNIQSFPVSLFGISLASAVFPDLSSQAAGREQTKLSASLQKSI